MALLGTKYPTEAENDGISGIDWTNPAFALEEGGFVAQAANVGVIESPSVALLARNFAFAIPDIDAIIGGIVVEAKIGTNAESLVYAGVELTPRDGPLYTTNGSLLNDPLPMSDLEWRKAGAPNDDWGAKDEWWGPLRGADVNRDGFGVKIWIVEIPVGSVVNIDAIRITLYDDKGNAYRRPFGSQRIGLGRFRQIPRPGVK